MVLSKMLARIMAQRKAGNMNDKLKAILARCKCSFELTVNQHRDYYQSAESYLKEHIERDSPGAAEIPEDLKAKMIATDTIVEVHFYPDTPIGFFKVWHHDLDAALDEALACLDEGKAK